MTKEGGRVAALAKEGGRVAAMTKEGGRVAALASGGGGMVAAMTGEGDGPAVAARRILVAGIGNVFLADDGFGPEAARALLRRPPPEGVWVEDFGIRGYDLAFAMLGDYDTVLLLDAAPHGATPGTVSVLEPGLDAVPQLPGGPDAHAMDPLTVLSLALRLGDGRLPRVLIVGCEPLVRMAGDEPEVCVGLSDPVREAVDRAVPLVEELLAELLVERQAGIR